MSEHHIDSRFVPADPDDPEIAAYAAKVREQFPVGPGEERLETFEWFEHTVMIEDVDGNFIGTQLRRTPAVGGTIRPTQPQPENGEQDV